MRSSKYGPRKCSEIKQKGDRRGTLLESLDLILTFGYEEKDRCLHFEY
ncbi:hypothetical protein Gotur_018449 [Gossypium turneri]